MVDRRHTLAVRIDAHQHFWRYTDAEFAWIDDTMGSLRRDFLPEDLAPVLMRNGFDGCVAVQARQSEEETRWLASLSKQHNIIRGVVGWTDLMADDLGEKLGRYAAEESIKGFRHVLQDIPDPNFMLQPAFLKGIEALARHDFSYDILVFERQLPSALLFIEALPAMRLVIDHIAKPEILHESWHPWADQIASIAQHSHVHCKLSGMVTEANWHSWTLATFERYIGHVLDCFGPERVMFGSDWPVCTVAANYGQVVEIVEKFLSRHCPTEIDAILGCTAARFYRLHSTA